MDYAESKIAKENSSTIRTQAGQAGAVPPPDSAPLVGGPRVDVDTAFDPVSNETKLEYVNDWDAQNFHQKPTNSLADVASTQLQDGHGSNGTSYKNSRR